MSDDPSTGQPRVDALAKAIIDAPPDEVIAVLREIWRQQRTKTAEQWDRTLPFGDYVVDRWEKAKLLGFGAGSSIYDSALVFGDVRVGANTWVGPFVILDGSGGLTLGANCSISAGVQIYSHDSVKWATSGGIESYEYARTTIGDNCYIGPNTIVGKGVTIGDGCIIGANSLVLESIAARSKAYGSPCTVRPRSE